VPFDLRPTSCSARFGPGEFSDVFRAEASTSAARGRTMPSVLPSVSDGVSDVATAV
jgi:hypothetical protein